jgi:DNA-binding XRE family transcriptional regulator
LFCKIRRKKIEIEKKKGLLQDQLGKLANIANITIVKIERGEDINPRLNTLKKIVRAIEVSTCG